MKSLKYNFFTTIFSFLFLFAFSSSAFAMGGIGGKPETPKDPQNPGWFMYSFEPGTTSQDTVVVTNNTNEEWIIDLYPADSIKSSGGGFALKQKSEKMESVGTWIKLEKESVQLKPYESQKVNFTVSIPSSLEVGEYSGAILFEKRPIVDNSSSEKKGGVKINVRTGVRIYETVPGTIKEQMSFDDLIVQTNEDGSKIIHSEVTNQGNVSSSVKYVTSVSKNGAEEKTESEFLVERGSTFHNNLVVEEMPKIGKVDVIVQTFLKDRKNVEILIGEKKASFIIIPWIELGIALTILLLLIIFLWWRNKKYSGKGWNPVTIKEGETLMSLASLYSIDWKIVAKVNKIKEPYIVNVGSSLLLPPLKTEQAQPQDIQPQTQQTAPPQ